MFPVQPQSNEFDDRGLFVVQDPDLRTKILPLFSFDPQVADERPIGQGTTFRIDLWSRCATAFHVVEDLFELDLQGTSIVIKPGIRLAALEMTGLTYGRMPIPGEAWRPLSGTFSLVRVERPPFLPPRLRNMTELAVMRIPPSFNSTSGSPFLPVDLGGWLPSVGERVLALGFADLDRGQVEEDDNRPMEQYLYGSYGGIIDIESADCARGRPWPQIRVDADWPGGMSGGPVFNDAGHVIGVVSAGIDGEGIGSATFFSGWDMPEKIFGSLDPTNPGWFRCYAVFDAEGAIVQYGQDRARIEFFAETNGYTDFSMISINPVTEECIRL